MKITTFSTGTSRGRSKLPYNRLKSFGLPWAPPKFFEKYLTPKIVLGLFINMQQIDFVLRTLVSDIYKHSYSKTQVECLYVC